MTKSTLSKDDWIAAGFQALSSHGPQALKAERLARDLGTTKGSFYWHFKDVAEFRASMIAKWQEHSMSDQPDTSVPAATRLRTCAQAATEHADPAIRAWALSDIDVAKALAVKDGNALAEIAALLDQCGVSNPELARVLYAATISINDLPPSDNAEAENAIGTLVDLILALR